MNELALFTGAGGGLLGSHLLGWRTVAAVEVEPYRREILLRRQRDGLLPLFPIWDDIRTFDGAEWCGFVDVVTAGFPCQPFSVAGKRRGEDDERNLWPETIRVIREVRPRFALLENVPGLLGSGYFDTILGDLAESGYDARWDCFPAGALGAHFMGDRLFVLATPTAAGQVRLQGSRPPETGKIWGRLEFERLVAREIRLCVPAGSRNGVSDGVAHRVDRLSAIGDGQVPAVVVKAWDTLTHQM